MEFVIFLILTCGEVTDSVLYNPQDHRYIQDSLIVLQHKMSKKAKKAGHKEYGVRFVRVKNTIGVCT